MQGRAIFIFIYMLGTRYPDASAKSFWTDAVWVGDKNLTNKELYLEVKKAYDILMTA